MTLGNDDLGVDGEEFVDELKPDTKLMLGQYTIKEFLAAGGFGITYLANDSLGRTIVIKECFPGNFCRRHNHSVMPRSQSHKDELKSIIRLFSQEARSLSKAGHPNIVGVHQVFEENNTAYMALDYVDGRDLLEILKEDPDSLTPENLQEYLVKMLDAIAHVHDKGLLHRDISPDNIIVRKDGEPVLIDFGAARESKDEKASRLLSALRVVKDGYSPQEFYIAGSDQGPSCDLYSLAASFYHLITGELPPDSQTRLSAYAAGEADPYIPLAKRTDKFPRAFCTALDKAIAVLPKERMQSASEWTAHLNGDTPAKTSVSGPVRSNEGHRKSTPMPVLFGGTAVAAAAGAGVFFFQTGRMPETDTLPTTATTVAVQPSAITAAEPLSLELNGDDVVEPAGTVTSNLPKPAASVDGSEGAETAAAPTESKVETELPFDMVLAPIDELTPSPTERISTTPAAPVLDDVSDTGNPASEPTSDQASVETEAQPVAAAPNLTARSDAQVSLGPVEVSSVMEAAAPILPFTLDDTAPGVLASVDDAAPSWLTPGARIVSVNGEATETNDQILARVEQAAASAGGDTNINIGLDAGLGDAAIERPLAIQTELQTALLNGLFFASGVENGEVVTRVVNVPEGSGFRIGDKVVAYVDTGERINADVTIKSILERELSKGRTSFSFAVERQGEMWVEAFKLAALGQ